MGLATLLVHAIEGLITDLEIVNFNRLRFVADLNTIRLEVDMGESKRVIIWERDVDHFVRW